MLRRVIARSRVAATKLSRAARDAPRLLRRVAPRNDGQAGFTLVEIIVALAILALGLGVILPAMSDALWRTGEAEAQAEAASLARSLLAQAGSAVPLTDGEAAGRFDNGFRWALHAAPYRVSNQVGPVRGYKVTAEVFWDDARHERSLALTTLRLGANAAGR
jgi:general secretion pathway protein I